MRSRRIFSLVAAGALALAVAGPAAAHPHRASNAHDGAGQIIANGQNHSGGPLPPGGVRCGGDPAAYGLETAHHGPDAGTPGKADGGCYTINTWDNPGIN